MKRSLTVAAFSVFITLGLLLCRCCLSLHIHFKAMIEITDIHKSYGDVEVLKGINLQVNIDPHTGFSGDS